MKRLIMVGVWIMIAATLSAFITTPLGFGTASGVVFAIGMLFSWTAGLITVTIWVARRFRPNRNGS